MFGVYVAGCAGGHLNPAITFVNCLFRGFPWKKLPIYALAQVLGCFCGAAIIYGNYNSAINAYEGGPDIRTVPGYSDTATAGVFCTYPAPFMSTVGMFFSEFLASAVLVFVIFALKGSYLDPVTFTSDADKNIRRCQPWCRTFSTTGLVLPHLRNRCHSWMGNWICH